MTRSGQIVGACFSRNRAGCRGAAGVRAVQQPQAQMPPAGGRKPNILVIWGDDVGIANVSAYSFGLMGYKTPNIDRISREVGDDRNEFLPGDRLASTERPDGVGAGGG